MSIAIIDDNLVNLKLIEGLVRKSCAPHVPLLFQDPGAGLAWCKSNEPDLVIVDYMMPVIDGIEFIRRFRAMPGRADIPVLMVTADHEKSTRHGALEAGASDFLTKPIDGAEFSARVKNMLALRASHKKLADRAAWLAEEVARATLEIREREREMVQRLARAAEFRDPETGGHILRMAHYSRVIAEALGLPVAEQTMILEAAPMHDIGKIAIPDHILLKPGRLTNEEFAIMKTHAESGWRILKDSTSPLLDAAAEIALSHHEKWDGTGYPHGLAGENIPLYGRIIAVADVFDALTSARPYKPAWEPERAYEFFREGAALHFDPACVDAFFKRQGDILDIRARFRDEDEGPETDSARENAT
jgi:putative two-component system response regulator